MSARKRKPKPDTISREQFLALKAGDVIVWRGKYLRTIEKGPGDYYAGSGYASIQLPIRLMSWTKRIYTVVGYNDVRTKIALAPKRTGLLMQPSEWKTLEGAGFDVRKELKRELREAEELAERMGRPLCGAYPRLSKLIRKAAR